MAKVKKKVDPALQHAIAAAGGPTKLAAVLGITAQAVCLWTKCPPRRAVAVERASGGVVRREKLCPQVFNPGR